jgi:ferredoxin
MNESGAAGQLAIVARDDLQSLLDAIAASGYRILGPTVRDGAIVYDEVSDVSDLPVGWTDEQDGGVYRLKRRDDDAVFGYAVGPQSWKRHLHPPTVRLWSARRDGRGFRAEPEPRDAPRVAFLGARSCEIHAIAVQDRVLMGGPFVDPVYRARRESVFVVAVNCGTAGGTCFCVSMNAGPRASSGFDLALTEIIDGGGHRFLVETGTEAGAAVLARVPHRAAGGDDARMAEAVVANTAASMGRSMDATDVKDVLYRNYDNARWDDVASRCLTCGNCTMVCPTCFCTTVEDVTDVTGDHAERWRRWDSCFTADFSYMHGGSVRTSPLSRYRQWMTHKLATWIDQFGTSGCVGCGRCITWCPVGIDITEEVRAIRASEAGPPVVRMEEGDAIS